MIKISAAVISVIQGIASQILCEPIHFQSRGKQLVHQPATHLSRPSNVFEYWVYFLKWRFLLRERDPSKSFSSRIKNDREAIGWKGERLFCWRRRQEAGGGIQRQKLAEGGGREGL